MTTLIPHLAERLAQRRRALRMPYPALAERSGVSEPTVKRILSGGAEAASFEKVAAVAEALGMPLAFEAIDPDEFRERTAREKAERIARLVQGTSALEGQAVRGEEARRLVERSYHELLAGSGRRLWGV
ncbi:MAG: helix-turn-helix domain-containing protein [Phycisphaerales bacterium]|nr:helix-turn-helix domain-containing protein [Phycisphaerales bacterium]